MKMLFCWVFFYLTSLIEPAVFGSDVRRRVSMVTIYKIHNFDPRTSVLLLSALELAKCIII